MKSFKKLLVVFSMLGLCITGCSNGQANKYKDDKRYEIYQLALADGYEGTYEQWLESIKGPAGQDGKDGKDGKDGQDGHSPVITIGDDGYWYIDGDNTHVKAQGPKGDTGPSGSDGVSVVSIEKTSSDGLIDTYTITYSNGNTSTFTITNGQNGQDGVQGQQGPQGQQGIQGNPGTDGHTPIITIGDNGSWYVDGIDTGIKAQGDKGDTGPQGEAGADGSSVLTGNGAPSHLFGNNGDSYIDLDSWNYYVKSNNEWFLKGNIKGLAGSDGQNGQDGVSVASIAYTSSNGLVDTYTITYSDGKTSTFTVTNGVNGNDGADGQSIQGQPGQDGHTPIITIGDTGNWYVDGVDTGIKAQGPQGEIGPQGPKGDAGISVVSTSIDENGDLIVTFSDGAIQNAGHIKDVDKCTVNFYVDDDLVATREVLKGQKVSRPTDEETAGYTINDWHIVDLGNPVSWIFDGYFAYAVHEDIDLFADFTYNCYTISFVDPKHNHSVDNIIVTYDKLYALPTISQTGYTFTGWRYNNELFASNGEYRIASDITLFAEWDANQYQVTLDPNGGLLEQNTVVVAYDSIYALPTPIRTNYIFLGWYEDNTRISSNATWKYAENKSFVAKWTNVTNTYVFDPGDGTCDTVSAIIGWEDEYQLPIPNCPSGLAFDGWYLEQVYIPLTGIWNYSNSGGTLVAKYYDANLFITNEGMITANTIDALSFIIPLTYHGIKTNIGPSAFSKCSSLTDLSIPEGVVSIGASAFSDCSCLANITIPNSVASIGKDAFYNCPSLVFSVYENASYLGNDSNPYFALVKINDESLTSISINDNCRIVCSEAFYFSHITSVTIPESVISLSDYAFYDCTRITSIIISNSTTSIGSHCFYFCDSLTSVTLPKNIVTLSDYAFAHCKSLVSIVLPETLLSIGSYCFETCESLANITLPENLASIGRGAFLNCDALTFFTLPDSITSISASAFYGCDSLKSVNFPNNLISIGSMAFAFCNSLQKVILPDSLTSIDYQAFYKCTSLRTITIPRNVSSMGNIVFSGCTKLYVYCRVSSKPSGWSDSWDEGFTGQVTWGYTGSVMY